MSARSRAAFVTVLVSIIALWAAAAAPAVPAPGSFLWSHTYGSTPTADSYSAVARCPDGGVVAVGTTNYNEVTGAGDGLISKYSAGGGLEWSHGFDAGESLDDTFLSVAVDHSGSVFVGGASESSISGLDYLVVKYGEGGGFKWARTIDGGASLDDGYRALVLDASGNPVVTGFARSAPFASRVMTLKLRSFDGDTLWTSKWSGPKGTQYADAWGISRAPKGGFSVAGDATNASSVRRMTVLLITAAGRVKWTRTYLPTGSTDTSGQAVAAGPDGTPYVLASTDRGVAGSDTLLVHYSSAGARMLVRRYDTGPGTGDRPYALAVDGAGRVFAAGASSPPAAPGRKGFLVSWTPAGKQRWAKAWAPAAGDTVQYYDVLPDAKGGAYVAGQLNATAGGTGTVMRHLGATGKLAWSVATAVPGGYDAFRALAFSGSAGVSAVGFVNALADEDAFIEARRK
jgi:hypothetical protein